MGSPMTKSCRYRKLHLGAMENDNQAPFTAIAGSRLRQCREPEKAVAVTGNRKRCVGGQDSGP